MWGVRRLPDCERRSLFRAPGCDGRGPTAVSREQGDAIRREVATAAERDGRGEGGAMTQGRGKERDAKRS